MGLAATHVASAGRTQQDDAMPNAPVRSNAAIIRTHAALAWSWLLAATPFLTDAACNMFVGFFLFLSWLLLAAAWVSVGAMWWPLSRPGRRWWLSAGLAGYLGAVLGFTDVGLVARVALSKPWLDAYAEGVLPGTHDFLKKPHRVGLFVVDGTQKVGGVVLLYTSKGFLDLNGVARFPDGPVPLDRIRDVRHLAGDWYSFEEKF